MNISTPYKSINKTLITALMLSTVFVSCIKNDTDYTPQPISGLSIIQASPTIEKLDFSVDNTKANQKDLIYTNKFDYLSLYPGSRQISVSKTGSATPVLSEKFTFDPQQGYSLFIVDRFENVKFLFIKDDLTPTAAGKAKVRFVNLSPDAAALNLAIAGKENDLFTNKLFKEYTTFETIDPAEKVTFNVKNKDNGLEASKVDVKIEAGKIYTVWVKGLKAATDDKKIGVEIFTNQ